MAAVVETFTPQNGSTGVNSLTCISCRMSFRSPKDQRLHYQTDIHRFNLKRKVAELPPVTQEVYEQKMAQDALNAASLNKSKDQSTDVIACTVCNKKFASPNTLATHVKSKKHLDKVAAAANKEETPDEEVPKKPSKAIKLHLNKEDRQKRADFNGEDNDTEMTEAEEAKIIDERIKNARKILPEECIFCLKNNEDLEKNAKHMATVHSFFIPDIEYLSDMTGLFRYLGEKISVGLTCIWCNEMFSSLEAVLNHMIDKSHCKLSYDHEVEYEDYYDFSKDYEEGEEVSKKKKTIELSDNGLELTLSDGRTIGHRSLNQYYQQNIKTETRASMLITSVVGQYKMLGYNSDWEKKHSRYNQMEWNDLRKQRRYEHSLGLVKNNQKHYKDPTKGF